MRYPQLEDTILLTNGAPYSIGSMLAEFVLNSGAWTADEASIASFRRIAAAVKQKPFALEDKDFDRIAAHLRQVNFPPHVALELGELRIRFILAPSEPAT
jgi:hypothetical protein